MRSSTRHSGGSNDGFTLLELMVVMGILGVLAGLGLGFLQRRGGDKDVALEMVRDELRLASLTARTRRLPTAVLLDPGQPGAAAQVRSRVLIPVGQWQMEERDRNLPDLVPQLLTGTVEPGRFGSARRPDLDQDLLNLSTRETVDTIFNLRDGFALHVDVKLDARTSMTVARLDANIVLSLDDALVPRARFVRREGDAAAGSQTIVGKKPLRLHRWTTLSFVHDGTELLLLVDGAVEARVESSASVYQSSNDIFTVSPATEPVIGLVDEVRLLAYEFTEAQTLPTGVELQTTARRIAFDADGRLAEPVTFELVFGDEREEYAVDPGGLIQ